MLAKAASISWLVLTLSIEFAFRWRGRRVPRLGSVVSVFGIGRIDEYGDTSGPGHQLTQELQPLCHQLSVKKLMPVACRPAARGCDKTEPDRVFTDGEDDGNRRGCRLGRKRRKESRGGRSLPPAANQFGRQRRQPVN